MQLFDLSGVRDAVLNYHLDCLCKSAAEEPPGDDGIWEPHPSVFLRSLVEAFTALGLKASDALKVEAIAWLSGAMHAQHGSGGATHPLLLGSGPHSSPPYGSTGGPTGGDSGSAGGSAAPGGPYALVPSNAWTRAQLLEVRAYLLSKPLLAYAVEDWLLMADYLVQSHLPAAVLAAQAEALATRAGLMGKVESDYPDATEAQVDNVLAAMPNTIAQAARLWQLSPAHVSAMVFGRARCAENVKNLSDGLRHQMKSLILQALEAGWAGDELGAGQALQGKLFDAFAGLNRDWRRIAVTEAGEIKNQGFVANQPLGSFVKRVERYRGACSFCRALDGRIFKVVQADDADKDGKLEIWPGKTNVGRSASPNKRVDGKLEPRLPSELWWAAAGVQHPHCRGVWVAVRPPLQTSTDKQWKAWLAALGMP